VYLRRSAKGLGLRLRNVDNRAVVGSFAPWFKTEEHNVRANDVIISVNSLDAKTSGFEKLLLLLRATPPQRNDKDRTTVGMEAVDDIVCVRLARPTGPIAFGASEGDDQGAGVAPSRSE
jgi:hypothetical protein